MRGACRIVLNTLWAVIFFAAIIILFSRIALAIDASKYGLPLVILIFLLLYMLFILEGLQVSSIQLKTTDRNNVEQFIKNNFDSRAKSKLNEISKKLVNKFDDFVIGRQVATIFTIVSLAFLFKYLPIEKTSLSFLPVTDTIGSDFWYNLVSHWAIAFLIATLLPSWLSQLFPQFIADQRGIAFLRLPGTKYILCLCMFVRGVGAGNPGLWLYNVVVKRSLLPDKEKLPAGSRAVFEELASYYGVYLENHNVQIEIGYNDAVIKEKITYNFISGKHQKFTHVLRVDGIVDLKEYTINPPDGLEKAQPSSSLMDNLTFAHVDIPNDDHNDYNKSESSSVEDHLEKKEYSDLNIVDTQSIIILDRPLTMALPREGKKQESAIVEVTYSTDATDPGLGEKKFSVQIRKPTRTLSLSLFAKDSLLMSEPDIKLFSLDQVERAGQLAFEEKKWYRDDKGEWHFELDHPPIASICEVSFKLLEPERPKNSTLAPKSAF